MSSIQVPTVSLYRRVRRGGLTLSALVESSRLFLLAASLQALSAITLLATIAIFFRQVDMMRDITTMPSPSMLAPLEPPTVAAAKWKRALAQVSPHTTSSAPPIVADSSTSDQQVRRWLFACAAFVLLVPFLMLAFKLFSSRPIVAGVSTLLPLASMTASSWTIYVAASVLPPYLAFFEQCPSLPGNLRIFCDGLEAALFVWLLSAFIGLVMALIIVIDALSFARKLGKWRRRQELREARAQRLLDIEGGDDFDGAGPGGVLGLGASLNINVADREADELREEEDDAAL